MNFTQAVSSVLGKYATFAGRACRSEFWYWTLFTIIVSIILSFVDAGLFASNQYGVLGLIFSLAVFIPGLAVTVRRLHDINRSGWWILIILIPLIGVLVLLYWEVSKGTEGTNEYGDNPLEALATAS